VRSEAVRTLVDPEDILDGVTFDDILSALGLDGLKHGRSRCPICKNKNPSVLHVDEEQGLYYCHRGSHGGDKCRLVEEVQGCSRREALSFIAELAGVEYDVSAERWKEWKRIRQQQRETLAWADTVLAILRDLDAAYRNGGTPAQRQRVARWIKSVEAMSGDELLAWYENRHLISDVATKAELAAIGEQVKQREARLQEACEDALPQLRLLACEATPEEWQKAFEGYLGRSKIKGKRDQRGVSSERGTRGANVESAPGDGDRVAVPAQ
jgi:hypothetical protein